jgi:hypothetical protein
MGRVARPSALTPERRERIESELADGIPIAIVAQNVEVGRSTLHEWIANGRVTRRRRRRDPLRLVARPDVAPTDATSELEERLRAAESGLVAEIVRASQRGSWQAAAWLLERFAPERWAKPSRTQALEDPRYPRGRSLRGNRSAGRSPQTEVGTMTAGASYLRSRARRRTRGRQATARPGASEVRAFDQPGSSQRRFPRRRETPDEIIRRAARRSSGPGGWVRIF